MPRKIPADKRVAVAAVAMKTLSAAVLSALVVANASAAGLGRLTVLSGLGQPLRAEIELNAVSKDEVGALAAKLASADAFRQANIDFNAALLSLRFNIEDRSGRQFILVSSAQPLNEPFVDMLLELSGPHGRLIREYTFLLDPPELRAAQATAVAPAAVPKLADTPAAPAKAAPASDIARNQRSSAAMESVPGAQSASSGTYQVRPGDTLAQIASQVKPAGVSLDQMLVALFQSNPEAFAEKNMNRLQAGRILSVPSAEVAGAVDSGNARGMIVAQAADFNAYRQRLAGQVEAASAQPSGEGRQGASGRITAQVEERATPASEARDKLQLSRAAPGSGSTQGGGEDAIAREKALAESQARVRELEKIVSDQQKLIELQNAGMAEQQKQAEATAASTSSKQAQSAQQETQPATTPPAEQPVAEQAPAAATQPARPAAAVTAPVQAEPAGFVDELLANPMTLPGLGGLLIALGGLGIYRARRSRKSKQFEDSIISDSSLKANSLFGSTGGQSVDTNNSVFNSSFSPSVSQLDSNEVDPVAEADVYIAYGRDAQAEEILKEALRTQPERLAVRVKLLEIYSNRKDLRAFEVVATELYGLTKGEGEEWVQAAEMGVALDPKNPLYVSAKSEPEDGAGDGKSEAEDRTFDEQGLSTLLATTQGDTTAIGAIAGLEGDTAYFNNTELTEEASVASVEADVGEAGEQADEEDQAPLSNEMDFNLDGMNLDVEVPNTMPRPASAEPTAELTSIDFDFLDTKAKHDEPSVLGLLAAGAEDVQDEVQDVEPNVMPDAEVVSSLDALELALNEMSAQVPSVAPPPPESSPADLSLDLSQFGLEATPDDAEPEDGVLATTDAHTDLGSEEPASDFDLSGISLELDSAPSVEPHQAVAGAGEESYGASEMATKLDLAIAYQEIGDKEGARELLDEVLKGGTPEQSEKAKSLLLELA